MRASVRLSATDSLTTRYDPVEAKGVTGSVRAGEAYTRLDGPRTDVNDHTYVWPTPDGVPGRVRDALGAETLVEYGDPRFPALATRVTAPSGVVSTAAYDHRGRVTSSTVTGAYGGTETSTTTYGWDDTCDQPATTRAPGADTVFAAYDPATCNVLWQRQGRSVERAVLYEYYPAGHPHAGQLRVVQGPVDAQWRRAEERLEYDAAGNLRKTISPLGFLTLHLRDALGRDTLTVTPVTEAGAVTEAGLLASGVRQRTTWDMMDRGRRTATIGPAMGQPGSTGIIPTSTGVDTLHVATDYDPGGLPLEVLRWASPDTARVHVLSTRYTYDAAGRRKTESELEGLEPHTYLYDPGSNVVAWITPRGDTIRSEYDALGRMVRRVVPRVRYPMVCPSQTTPCQNPYPHHPNGSAGSLVVPEEWTAFRFDSAGGMAYAENADAIVTRGYYPNGALRTDSLAIRSLEGVDFTRHRYGLAYAYNAAGQLTSMQHPANLATNPSEQWDRYGYNAVTGALDTLTLGHSSSCKHCFSAAI